MSVTTRFQCHDVLLISQNLTIRALSRLPVIQTRLPVNGPFKASAPTTLWFPGIVAFTRGRASLVAGVSADLAHLVQADHSAA